MSSRFYNKKIKLTKEISLRNEFQSTLFGSSVEIPKAFSLILRQFRKDSNGNKIACTCNVQELEGQRHQKCVVCLGEGFLWDESLIDVYKVDVGSDSAKTGANVLTEMGKNKKVYAKFYVSHNASVTEDDKLVELVIDAEGDLVVPHKRRFTWEINELSILRSDHGRIEFMTIYCKRENYV